MTEEILKYYDEHKRNLPWRKTKDPYSVWISEIMCQQTRVETVIPYYERFMRKYPDVVHLADAEDDELMKLWQGLGYYSRARNLKKAAKAIVEGFHSEFPKNYKDVLSLPGIGAYTASAILSMAFDEPYAAVDGNFLRVFSRFYGDYSDVSEEKTKKALTGKLVAIMPGRSGDFNQAVMDIGATICVPNGRPSCDLCPLREKCFAFQNNQIDALPYSSKETKVTGYDVTVFLIQKEGKTVLRKRPEKGLLASLYEFPNVMEKTSLKKAKEIFREAEVTKGDLKVHHFSHQTWKMQAFLVKDDQYQLKEGEFLATDEEIKSVYSLPKAFSQFLG